MDLIPESDLNLRNVTADPIGEIIRSSTVIREMNLGVRTRLIAELIVKIDELEDQGEKTFSRNMMLGIGSSFSMAAAIASTGALAPVAGICLSVSALGSWGACMYEVFTENLKLEPIRDALKRLSLALKSAPTDKWAAVWAVAGDDIFIYALKEATKGDIVRNQLVQVGSDRPIDRAIDCVAAFKGLTYEAVTASARAVLTGKIPSPTIQPELPTQPKPTFEAIDVAAVIGADLAEGVERAKEERKAISHQPSAMSKIPASHTKDTTHGAQLTAHSSDIVELILSSVNSLAFIGGQRCGKSLLMAIASRIGVQRGKFKGAFVISSLAKAGEDDHYWQHCATKTFYDLAVIVDKTNYYQQYLDTIRAFKKAANAQNPQLLIIDEFAYLCERLEDDLKRKDTELGLIALELMQEIAELASVVASGGAKRGWYLWLGSPKGAIGNMGRGGKAMKELSLIFCAIPPGTRVDSNGVTVQWDENLCNATALNWKALSKPPRGVEHDLGDRIVWMNGKWYAKSSYTLEAIVTPIDQTSTIETIAAEDALSSNDRQSLKTAVAVQDKSQADVMIELLEKSKSQTIEEFIQYDLKAGHRVNEVKPRIIAVLKRYNRPDLLKRFSIS